MEGVGREVNKESQDKDGRQDDLRDEVNGMDMDKDKMDWGQSAAVEGTDITSSTYSPPPRRRPPRLRRPTELERLATSLGLRHSISLDGGPPPPKLNTLEKSEKDWRKYVREVGGEGLEDDLRLAAKSGSGYLDKKEFLQRTDEVRERVQQEGLKTRR